MVTVEIEFHDPEGLNRLTHPYAALKYPSYVRSLEQALDSELGDVGIRYETRKNPDPKGMLEWNGQKHWWYARKDPDKKYRYPRPGAFEVVMKSPGFAPGMGLPEQLLVWSKINTHRWPDVDKLAKAMAQVLSMAQSGQDVSEKVAKIRGFCDHPAHAQETDGSVISKPGTARAASSSGGKIRGGDQTLKEVRVPSAEAWKSGTRRPQSAAESSPKRGGGVTSPSGGGRMGAEVIVRPASAAARSGGHQREKAPAADSAPPAAVAARAAEKPQTTTPAPVVTQPLASSPAPAPPAVVAARAPEPPQTAAQPLFSPAACAPERPQTTTPVPPPVPSPAPPAPAPATIEDDGFEDEPFEDEDDEYPFEDDDEVEDKFEQIEAAPRAPARSPASPQRPASARPASAAHARPGGSSPAVAATPPAAPAPVAPPQPPKTAPPQRNEEDDFEEDFEDDFEDDEIEEAVDASPPAPPPRAPAPPAAPAAPPAPLPAKPAKPDRPIMQPSGASGATRASIDEDIKTDDEDGVDIEYENESFDCDEDTRIADKSGRQWDYSETAEFKPAVAAKKVEQVEEDYDSEFEDD